MSRFFLQTRSPLRTSCKDQKERGEHILPPSQTIVRCDGTRKADGFRCVRKVKIDFSSVYSNPHYCCPHRLQKSATVCRNIGGDKLDDRRPSKKNVPQTFTMPYTMNDYLNFGIKHKTIRDLHVHYHKIIRKEMMRSTSPEDGPGYIYVYSLEQGPRVANRRFAYFKIGRSVDPYSRMSQMLQRCQIIPNVVEIFPQVEAPESMLCQMSHRVERLILLELMARYNTAGFKCKICGTTHREWVRVSRINNEDGKCMTDHEIWTARVRPIILRWIQFGIMSSSSSSFSSDTMPTKSETETEAENQTIVQE
ncbi:hypothetical protein J3Q64DRAFT_1709127 [Phycomyces blakesleeanus]|uniref:Bacteriophage T5 Orf172 DNA-binding domain-containing protein n=1 Tax=Phycomyces blakesleeanus TaxID=4837 RepID=A0ABR3BD12_PHYBL